jgi:hypothetical protein
MKFRVPELFLGVLLAVAVFIMGMMFSRAQQPVFLIGQSEQSVKLSQPAGEFNRSGSLTDWFTKDASGFFTFVLAIVGASQAVLFLFQLDLFRKSLAPAEAAAKAAQAAAEHIPAVERAYIFLEVGPIGIHRDGGKSYLELVLRNFGQTPGSLKRIFGKFHLEEPTEAAPSFGVESLVWDAENVVLAKDDGQWRIAEPLLSDNLQQHYFSGCVEYEDIFGRPHTSRLCVWLVPETGMSGPAGPLSWGAWD